VLGVVVRRYGDVDASEDAVQEALLAAADHWSRAGVPEQPKGWLVTTASRRLIDVWRAERSRRDREALTALREPEPVEGQDHDDTLTMLLLCCHPALTPASAIALTLRAVGGLTTAEIARAFLVPEATMAQRIARSKQRVRSSDQPWSRPTADELPGRLRQVLHVLYLVFNEGYTATSGPDLQRVELSAEAIRLTRMVRRARPDDDEVAGLLALMLLVDARRPARVDAMGESVPLGEQDRSRWDRAKIAEGTALVDEVLVRGVVGEYQLQAAVAALHDRAPRAEDTDWPQIHALYGVLDTLSGNPVVTLNRAVALGMAAGPEAGLACLDEQADRLAGLHRLDAVRAHLLELAGDVDGAVAHYEAAARRSTSVREQTGLSRRAARLRSGLSG
jgi:RNA polymerase sigma factor (sigma-70 family)